MASLSQYVSTSPFLSQKPMRSIYDVLASAVNYSCSGCHSCNGDWMARELHISNTTVTYTEYSTLWLYALEVQVKSNSSCPNSLLGETVLLLQLVIKWALSVSLLQSHFDYHPRSWAEYRLPLCCDWAAERCKERKLHIEYLSVHGVGKYWLAWSAQQSVFWKGCYVPFSL
jgi:hypothetical protein